MSAMRPDQIKQDGVFIPAVSAESGGLIDPTELLARLGRLGYDGSVIDASERIPEELMPFDPETDGSIGHAFYEELSDFVTEQGSQKGLATQIWGEFVANSAYRAVNNRFWEETVDLRDEKTKTLAEHDATIHALYANLYPEELTAREDRDVRQQINATAADQAVQRTELDHSLIAVHDAITGQKTPEDFIDRKLGRILHDLRDPAEVGEPFVFVRKEGSKLEPLLGDRHSREFYAGTTVDLDEVYKALATNVIFRLNPSAQKIPQLTIQFLNRKIAALKANK